MTEPEIRECMVVLNVAPQVEEAVVDWLLARTGSSGFTSFPVAGHSTRHDRLSIAEQVAGRQRRVEFQVQMDAASVDGFLADAASSLGTLGVRYWVFPVWRAGHLSDE